MWQRFTERARRVILLGQEEAGKMNSGHVSTEHLLLGLVRENEGVGAQVLHEAGVTLEIVRLQVESEVRRGPEGSGGEPKLLPSAKRVLELAADEARRLRHNYIGTEHLLLGLLREKDGLAATVLRRLGFTLEKARSQVMKVSGPDARQTEDRVPTPPAPRTPTARVASDFRLTPDALLLLVMAAVQAEQTMHKQTRVEHLLLAMLDYEAGEAAQFLQEMGVDLNAARAALRAKKTDD